MSNDTTPYFSPDPYDTGEAVSVEATSLEEAQKLIQDRAPKSDDKPADTKQTDAPSPNPAPVASAPTETTPTDTRPAETTPAQDSAPAPEANESLFERTNS
jgi:hypothetical protein